MTNSKLSLFSGHAVSEGANSCPIAAPMRPLFRSTFQVARTLVTHTKAAEAIVGLSRGHRGDLWYEVLFEEGPKGDLRITKTVLGLGANRNVDLNLVRRTGLRSFHDPVGAIDSGPTVREWIWTILAFVRIAAVSAL